SRRIEDLSDVAFAADGYPALEWSWPAPAWLCPHSAPGEPDCYQLERRAIWRASTEINCSCEAAEPAVRLVDRRYCGRIHIYRPWPAASISGDSTHRIQSICRWAPRSAGA